MRKKEPTASLSFFYLDATITKNGVTEHFHEDIRMEKRDGQWVHTKPPIVRRTIEKTRKEPKRK